MENYDRNTRSKKVIYFIRQGRKGREKAVRHLLKDISLQNGIKKIVARMGGGPKSGEEVINLTMIQFIKTVLKTPSLEIRSDLNCYLFGIARNVYLQILRNNRHETELLENAMDIADEEAMIDLKLVKAQKHHLLRHVLDRLGKNCHDVLYYWASGYTMAEIAAKLHYRSDAVVRQKKMVCLRELLKYLDNKAHIKAELT